MLLLSLSVQDKRMVQGEVGDGYESPMLKIKGTCKLLVMDLVGQIATFCNFVIANNYVL